MSFIAALKSSQNSTKTTMKNAILSPQHTRQLKIRFNPMIDPSAALRTTVRAGTDRVLGDKERRLTEIS